MQFIVRLPVFKKKIYSYLHNNFVSVYVLEPLFSSLSDSKNSHIFLGGYGIQDPLNVLMYLE